MTHESDENETSEREARASDDAGNRVDKDRAFPGEIEPRIPNADPLFFILTTENRLHAYWDIYILLSDLARYRGVSSLYRRISDPGRLTYAQITETEIREGWNK